MVYLNLAFYNLGALAFPRQDSFKVIAPLVFKPDTSLVGLWEGNYLDFNEGNKQIIIKIDSCDSEYCYGFYTIGEMEAHSFKGFRSVKGSEIFGRFEFGWKFRFSLSCLVQTDMSREGMPERIGKVKGWDPPNRWVLEGRIKEIYYKGYTEGPVVLWKK